MSSLTLSQFEQYLSKAAWILKGPIDASDFKAYIFPILIFKCISDVYDEEYQAALKESGGDEEYAALPEFHRFVIPEGCHRNNFRETTSNVGLKIEQTPAVVERVVNDIEEIVKVIRFPGWQDSSAGGKEVAKALRRSLLKYQLHKDQDLFDRAYGYIREYY